MSKRSGIVNPMPLGAAIEAAARLPIDESTIQACIDTRLSADELFERARTKGLETIERSQRSGHLARVIGEVAESVAEIILAENGYNVFWQITRPGIHGVDLLLLAPDDAVLALEVKGTLRPGAVPRLTPSLKRQMSRRWLNDPKNPAMVEWSLKAADLYAGVMVVDLALAQFRVAVSDDFEYYVPIAEPEQLYSISSAFCLPPIKRPPTVHAYTTTIVSSDGSFAAEVITLPRYLEGDGSPRQTLESLIEKSDLVRGAPVTEASLVDMLEQVAHETGAARHASREAISEVVETLARGQIAIIERSPARSSSLGRLLSQAPPAYILAAQGRPFLALAIEGTILVVWFVAGPVTAVREAAYDATKTVATELFERWLRERFSRPPPRKGPR